MLRALDLKGEPPFNFDKTAWRNAHKLKYRSI